MLEKGRMEKKNPQGAKICIFEGGREVSGLYAEPGKDTALRESAAGLPPPRLLGQKTSSERLNHSQGNSSWVTGTRWDEAVAARLSRRLC